MTRQPRIAWILSVSLVVLSSCKSDLDDKPAADPLDDPWVDAIDTGDEEPAVAAGSEAVPSAEPSFGDPVGAEAEGAPLAFADPGSPPESQPAAAVPPNPSKDEDEAKPATATSSDASEPPAATPEQPAPEAPAVDGQPAEPTPAPVAEPTTPSAEPAKPASPPPITIADFHGSYRFSGGSSQRAALADAIEATVKQLPRAFHGIARKRLTAANPVDGSIDIVIAGDKITTTFESSLDVTCVIDGATVNTTDIEGGKLEARVRSKGSKLVQILEGKDGARTIVYVLSADRKKLTVHHKITADRLPAPIIYRLTYSRK